MGIAASSRRLIWRLIVLVAVLVGAGAGQAEGATTDFDLSATGQTSGNPSLAVDEEGDAVVTWQRFDAIARGQVRGRTAAGALSATNYLSGAGTSISTPDVASDSDGDSVTVWSSSDGTHQRIRLRTRAPNGTLSATEVLSSAGQDAISPQVTVDDDGDALAVWYRFDGTDYRIQSRARAANGTLGPVQNLSSSGHDSFNPQVDMDADGDAVVVWEGGPSGGIVRIRARGRAANGSLGPIQTLSADGQNASAAQVAVADDGDALAVWSRPDGSFYRVQGRFRSASGALSPTQTLSGLAHATGAQVGIDADGDAVVVWLRTDGADFRNQLRARDASGTLSAVQTLSPVGQAVGDPQVAVDDAGDAVAVWNGSDGSNSLIRARTRSAAGSLGAVQTLSDAGQNALKPQVDVSGAGLGLAVWQRFDGSNNIVQGAPVEAL